MSVPLFSSDASISALVFPHGLKSTLISKAFDVAVFAPVSSPVIDMPTCGSSAVNNPDITPVEVFNVNPAGKEPVSIE